MTTKARRWSLRHQYDGGLWFRHVRTEKDGTEVVEWRTVRGREQYEWNWMQRHPHLFTRDAIRAMKHQRGKPHRRKGCHFCESPTEFTAYMEWRRSPYYQNWRG